MVFSEAKCNKCNTIFTITKNSIMENFSDLTFTCTNCGSKDTNICIGLGAVDVALGIHGNGTTGYDKEFVYKPSTFGKFKGTKVR